jgi:NAD(P)H-hydrate epimerase
MTTSSSRPELIKGAAWADKAFASSVLPRREVGAHKWGVGGTMVIAGSPSYIGAAYLSCRAAGRAGAGVVHLAASRAVIAMLAGVMPEVAHIPLPETDMPSAARKAAERISPKLEKARAVVIGPGLGEDELAHHLLVTLLGFGDKRSATSSIGFGRAQETAGGSAAESTLFQHDHLRVVIDADALKWLSNQEEWWARMPGERLVLTPHIGEMERLTGLEAREILDAQQDVAQTYARKWGTTVVLKSGHSVASDGASTLVAADAPPSLATAGTGDVLAGMLGAYLAQQMTPIDAAGLALYAGSRAARIVEERFGELGVIATDLPDAIAIAMRDLT